MQIDVSFASPASGSVQLFHCLSWPAIVVSGGLESIVTTRVEQQAFDQAYGCHRSREVEGLVIHMTPKDHQSTLLTFWHPHR
jgi:hypothetical protein